MNHCENDKLVAPNGEHCVLLHVCCAVCAGVIIRRMVEAGLRVTLFFYNPNIHPEKEYELRKEENSKFARMNNIEFFDADYDVDQWVKKTQGFESEPERGKRCALCFDMRFEKTARFAHEKGFKVFASTLGISRWKDMEQVNLSGVRAASQYPGLIYWTHNWRKKGGSERMSEIAKEEKFYKQEYCGCSYSLKRRDNEIVNF